MIYIIICLSLYLASISIFLVAHNTTPLTRASLRAIVEDRNIQILPYALICCACITYLYADSIVAYVCCGVSLVSTLYTSQRILFHYSLPGLRHWLTKISVQEEAIDQACYILAYAIEQHDREVIAICERALCTIVDQYVHQPSSNIWSQAGHIMKSYHVIATLAHDKHIGLDSIEHCYRHTCILFHLRDPHIGKLFLSELARIYGSSHVDRLVTMLAACVQDIFDREESADLILSYLHIVEKAVMQWLRYDPSIAIALLMQPFAEIAEHIADQTDSEKRTALLTDIRRILTQLTTIESVTTQCSNTPVQ